LWTGRERPLRRGREADLARRRPAAQHQRRTALRRPTSWLRVHPRDVPPVAGGGAGSAGPERASRGGGGGCGALCGMHALEGRFVSEGLQAAHTVNFSYRRSVGGAVERFLTRLAHREVWGSRGGAGNVVVPPVDDDPLVLVGDAGVV